MPIVDLTAGAKLDILNQQELETTLKKLIQQTQAWRVDVTKGARFIEITAQAPADAAGLVKINQTTITGGQLAPKPGMIWAVTRLSATLDTGLPPTAFTVYQGSESPTRIVRTAAAANNGYMAFGTHDFIVGNANSLLFSVPGATATTGWAAVYGSAIEFPQQLLHRWLVG